MPRVVKDPEVRRAEILDVAERLFRDLGYSNCPIERIIREVGVAKGTFYYYFRSKDEILRAIVNRTLDRTVDQATAVADAPDLTALQKFELLLKPRGMGGEDALDVAEMLHAPENRELHELTNVQSVLRLSPVLGRIVEQGNAEGTLSAEQSLETIQFLFTGAQFLLDGGIFGFTGAELRTRRAVAKRIIEQALGAQPGSFDFMLSD